MAEKNLEKIEADGQLLAIVVRGSLKKPGYNFVSPVEFPLQLGVSIRKKGDSVKPHRHLPFKEMHDLAAQEILYIESGQIEVSLFHDKKKYKIVRLRDGDMILLNCGHEVRFLKDTKMVEVKQGPYRGRDVEKEYF
ncbi:hypothetical protein HYW20_08485 [Candidatus Woesearchaeota archaeon]|nr:hypothetical protein [Candidatus Woesearchaeota archaeon]